MFIHVDGKSFNENWLRFTKLSFILNSKYFKKSQFVVLYSVDNVSINSSGAADISPEVLRTFS